jgi:regulator of protease activity HflC (stomatin/prohibitin superfamily)
MSGLSARPTPWGQSYRIAFFALYATALFAAASWLFSCVHQVTPGSRAVVFQFGKASRVVEAGLLLAWPHPIDSIEWVPAGERILEHDVVLLSRSRQLELVNNWDRDGDAGAGAGYLLTGDAGVVQLDVRVFWRVSDPVRYAVQRNHIEPLIDRLTERAATVVCAGRDLDAILVARPEMQTNDQHTAEERARLRGDLKQLLLQSLAQLAARGDSPGITIERVDIASSLPTNAVAAFNAVLTASQQADQAIAGAHTDATLRAQQAQQEADRMIQQAQARREETLAKAHVDTQLILQLAQSRHEGSDGGMLQRLWRDSVSRVLAQAGQVVTVAPGDESRLIIQGPFPSTRSEKKP